MLFIVLEWKDGEHYNSVGGGWPTHFFSILLLTAMDVSVISGYMTGKHLLC